MKEIVCKATILNVLKFLWIICSNLNHNLNMNISGPVTVQQALVTIKGKKRTKYRLCTTFYTSCEFSDLFDLYIKRYVFLSLGVDKQFVRPLGTIISVTGGRSQTFLTVG